MERLTARLDDGRAYLNTHSENTNIYQHEENNPIAKLADYEDAEEQGRIVKLPLSFGDQIFEIYNNCIERKIIQKTVRGFTIFEDYLYVETNNGSSLNAKKFGEIFFKTYDEAEAKLAEMEKQCDLNLMLCVLKSPKSELQKLNIKQNIKMRTWDKSIFRLPPSCDIV